MWFELYYLSEWVIRITMLGVVPRRRKPSSALAWLLVVFSVPWLGLVLYLLIGARTVGERRRNQVQHLRDHLQSIRDRFHNYPSEFLPEISDSAGLTPVFVERLGSLPALGANSLEILPDPDLFVDRLVRDIDGAHHHVHLLFYIYNDDQIGRRVADSLASAVKRGVSCRVLADALGSRPMFRSLGRKMQADGIEVHAALPVGSLRRSAGRVDIRNHRKIAVIDGHTAYTGSQNITHPSYGHRDLVWRDLMARVAGPIVLELQAIFVSDWYAETDVLPDSDALFPTPRAAGRATMQILPSGPVYQRQNYQRLVVAALQHARERVVITTPYFVPDEAFMQALETACLRGAKVELIVPHRTDQRMPTLAARSYYDELLEYGVQIYLYDDGLLHAKTMTIDNGLAFFGSSNFDIRSFALDFEVNTIFYGAEETAALIRLQEEYMRKSNRLELDQWRARPHAVRLAENVARLLSPLL